MSREEIRQMIREERSNRHPDTIAAIAEVVEK